MNAAACRSLKSCWITISFLNRGNRYVEALTITKIRSFKHKPFFFSVGAEGGGGELICSTYFSKDVVVVINWWHSFYPTWLAGILWYVLVA